jgi:hypothetical protein
MARWNAYEDHLDMSRRSRDEAQAIQLDPKLARPISSVARAGPLRNDRGQDGFAYAAADALANICGWIHIFGKKPPEIAGYMAQCIGSYGGSISVR